MDINELTNEDVLKWVRMKWNELHDRTGTSKEIPSKEYVIRRKAYEQMVWELEKLINENR